MAAKQALLELEKMEAASVPNVSLPLSHLALPLVLQPAKRLSDSNLIRLCESVHPVRMEESEHGELILMAPAGARTGTLEAYLAHVLYGWAEREGQGTAFGPSAGFRLPNTSVLAPDGAWVSNKRWHALSREQQEGFAPCCPEFVIELRSPTDRAKDIEAKMGLWMQAGAKLAWLIDPKRLLVKVFRPSAAPETLRKPQVLHGEGSVAGFKLEMERFWK